jgi:hypothetical protein
MLGVGWPRSFLPVPPKAAAQTLLTYAPPIFDSLWGEIIEISSSREPENRTRVDRVTKEVVKISSAFFKEKITITIFKGGREQHNR